ncbi:hypothetical protein F4809DRAFT_652061 [Biscogniauxia mediterranea]|nr:hypothetical protein F4809DRAFT_652061 [Biscogniauxia mediterranea]
MDDSHLQQLTPSSSESSSRSSFSSVRETNLAQTFTSTKVSSYSEVLEEAVEDQPSPGLTMAATTLKPNMQFMPPMTRPNSRLHGGWCPAVAVDSFRGWKQIDVRGRLASRSFGDLQTFKMVWSTPSPAPKTKGSERPRPGQSPIERLPTEILNQIIDHLVLDVPPNGISARNVDLMSMLMTSRTLHSATLNALYRNITIPHSKIFRKFLNHVSANPELGTIVRRLDFSHFNPTAMFSTDSERATTQNLTAETLLQCLELTPYLREFLAQEHIDRDIDSKVLRKLFFGLEQLQGVDFCGCSSPKFKDAFQSILLSDWPQTLTITRLSLHKCIILPSSIYETLLPRLGNLTHLDVAGTRITNAALMSIPHTARLTHLNLAKCKLLTSDVVIDFLTNHPAARNLVYLSVATDARSHQLLDENDLKQLIPVLPSTLRSLSLKGSRMASSHIDLLRPLMKHLEELSLGRRLAVKDIHRLFAPDENDSSDATRQWAQTPHTLKYLDLSDYLPSELNLNELFSRDTSVMQKASAPLEVVEIAEELYSRLSKWPALHQFGWTVRDFSCRAWLVRLQGPERRDTGLRSWKMGASYWGMRKIPVAKAEVGGMYGAYMFQRGL